MTIHLWDLAHRLTRTQLPNGSVVNRSYDSADRLTYIGDLSGGIGFTYGLDANGNRLTITENSGDQAINQYDAKNRLISEVRTGMSAYAVGYQYDLNDSLLARDLPTGGRVTFTLDTSGKDTGDTAGSVYSRSRPFGSRTL